MNLKETLQGIKEKIKDLDTVVIVKLKLPSSLNPEQASRLIQMYSNNINNLKLDDSMSDLEAARVISTFIRIIPIFHNKEEVEIELLSNDKMERRINKLEERIKLLEEKLGGN